MVKCVFFPGTKLPFVQSTEMLLESMSLSVLFAPGSSNAAGEIIGMPNGRTSDDYVGADGQTYAGVADRHIYAQTHPALRKKDVPMVLLTTAEVHFLIGEAIIRGLRNSWTASSAVCLL